MPKFVEQFGELSPETGKYVLSPDRLAYLNSLPLITYAFGVVLSSRLSERFGRRLVFLLMNSICATGAAVSYTSTTYGQILAGRMVLQVHIGMKAALVPIFMGELAPAANEKAAEMLSYINGLKEGFVVEDQIKLLGEALDGSVEQGKWGDMLKGTNKKRTITACIAAASSMLTGMSFAANYGAIFLAQVNVLDPFMITMAKRAVLLLGPITVMACIDRLGRRMQIVPSEISHISLRDKTSMVYWIVSDVCNFIATFTLLYLLQAPYANLGAKVGFIYAATSIGFLVWAFLCYHDLTGRSLEEVDEMFEAGVPAWRSKSWVSTSKMAQLTAMENSKGGVILDEKKALDVEDVTYVERK
ncbi:hypothetical protein GGTG_03620 [Gaeumannomyces tritici R3-111a-1]|uniref:Major facilitator superfamily (MFS) profile domain-containing protein n=1 Tax=Gaeumannomyces tritici (strain R3-111a-1) TaxID=644352 RepID=J3NQR4_GAET3|nr:hypothetical protein GGTG_03620 [Gaeumannomyces tritici R3-111a-1]EJT78520.1 hypothetical protein GGTG_03620 [Gaeumannomyces tritici R3-111a-1]